MNWDNYNETEKSSKHLKRELKHERVFQGSNLPPA